MTPRPLFDDLPVTQDEIDAWLLTVPHLTPGSERAATYTRQWRVAEKIREAKRKGTMPRMLSDGTCAHPTACTGCVLRPGFVE